jgi:hypothetical protein
MYAVSGGNTGSSLKRMRVINERRMIKRLDLITEPRGLDLPLRLKW